MNVTLKAQSAQLTINILDRRTLDGIEYAVAPAVIVREMVLNGEFLPQQEIGSFVDAWNGRPLVLRHPRQNGVPVSASQPDVLAQVGMGIVLNCQMDGNRLTGELWLNVAKCQSLGGDALATLQRMERGEVVELSSAYFCELEAIPGVFNGNAYSGVQRGLRPDHVALLPDEVGACSVRDGCGAPRTNQASDSVLTLNSNRDGVMIAFFVEPSAASALTGLVSGLPEGSEALPASELHLTLAYLGSVDDVAMSIGEGDLLRMLMSFASNHAVMSGNLSGIARFNSEEGEMEPIVLLFDAPALPDFRGELLDWMGWAAPVSRKHGYTPHITLAYVPAGASLAMGVPSQQNLVFDSIALAWGGRVTSFTLQGDVRSVVEFQSEELTMNDVQKQQAKVEPCTGEQPTANAQAVTPTLPPEVVAFQAMLAGFGGPSKIQEALQAITINANRQRDELIGRIKANQQNALTDEMLKAMPLEALDALDRTLRPVDFAGRGGVRANQQQDEEWEPYTAPETKK